MKVSLGTLKDKGDDLVAFLGAEGRREAVPVRRERLKSKTSQGSG